MTDGAHLWEEKWGIESLERKEVMSSNKVSDLEQIQIFILTVTKKNKQTNKMPSIGKSLES